MANCANCGTPLEGYSTTCRNCGAYQVAPGATTQPQQPTIAYYPQGSYPGQYPYQGQQPAAPPPPQKNRALLPVVIGLGVLLALVVGGIALFALLGGDDGDTPVAAASTSSSSASEAESGSAESPSPSLTPTPQDTPTAAVTQTVEPQETVTVTKKPKPLPTVTVTEQAPDTNTDQQSSARDCGNDIWADGTASCPFAGNVTQAWYDSGGASTLYDVYSPVTGQYYDLDCWGSQPVTCQVGRAIVFFYEQ